MKNIFHNRNVFIYNTHKTQFHSEGFTQKWWENKARKVRKNTLTGFAFHFCALWGLSMNSFDILGIVYKISKLRSITYNSLLNSLIIYLSYDQSIEVLHLCNSQYKSSGVDKLFISCIIFWFWILLSEISIHYLLILSSISRDLC